MPKNAKNWTANQYKFLLWLAKPSRQRIPLTQGMLADELGVNETTLSRWKQIDGFEEARLRLIRESIGAEAHEVMGAFIDEAKKGQFQQQKTWLEMMGWYTPTNVLTGKDGAPLISVSEIVERIRVADDNKPSVDAEQ